MRKGLSTTTRLSIGLVSIMMTILFLAHQVGLIPNAIRERLAARAKLSQSIAIQFAIAARNIHPNMAQAAIQFLVEQNEDILSMAIIANDQSYVAETENHSSIWESISKEQSVATHLQIPLFMGETQLGAIQICFDPIVHNGLLGSPVVRIGIFLVIVGVPIYWLYLRRTFKYLDPSKVIPGRVKAILDTLSEGALVLDNNEEIIFANEAFITATGKKLADLQGRQAAMIAWNKPNGDPYDNIFPWDLSTREGESIKGLPLSLQTDSAEVHTFMVNSTPIRGASGKIQGALATFDDVTEIEGEKQKLETTVTMLNESKDKIKQQNDELKTLSMQDPLTGCLNRRAFFEKFEIDWSGASRYGYALGCIMVDIDHFKSINDNHGHAIGDQVLQKLSEILRTTTRRTDSVCRYGGEEFCILLPNTNINGTYDAAEKIRKKIEASNPANLKITASLGVSALELNAETPHEMIDQADKALYASKNTGRNQVIRWDKMPDDIEIETERHDSPEQPREEKQSVHISFSAASALMSALEHRDTATAVHSRNVAKFCVAMAKGLMSESDCFTLEIAGLLHDIGKIGVPDSILLKPGPLTKEEWEVMETHDKIGVEIISASFGSAELTNIVRNCHAWYEANPRSPDLPTGQDIPLRSRIILIADAYDAMTSDRVYRKAMSQEAALAELRKCAGKQFDPELVERFIDIVSAQDENRDSTALSSERADSLRIGIEIEKLACAAETRDISLLSAIAEELINDADKSGLTEIAELADNLKQSANAGSDIAELIEQASELIDLCKSHESYGVNSTNQSQAGPFEAQKCPATSKQ